MMMIKIMIKTFSAATQISYCLQNASGLEFKNFFFPSAGIAQH